MQFTITDGVELTIIPTRQFKTNQLIINFSTPQTAENITARSLVADLLETSSQKYPNQVALARRQAELFGAYVGMNASRLGNFHTVKLRASFLNDRYAQPGLLTDVVDLTRELLFNPLLTAGQFDQQTFELQKQNLASSIESLSDDKQFYAAMELRKLYFDVDSAMQIPSFGTVQDLESITAQSLVDTYQSMLRHDQIEIVVLGDVDEQTVLDQFQQFGFTSRTSTNASLYYRQAVRDQVREREERQTLNQSKLNMAYHLPIYFEDADYYAAVVMNGILGGTPLSKLFVNVREKASLAYYANSNFNGFTGLLTIQTGIESRSVAQARKLINQQVEQVIAGDFTDELLQEVKDGLENHFLSGLDSSSNRAERELMNAIFDRPSSVQRVVEQIRAVDSDSVIATARQLRLQAVYYLNGESN